MTEQEFQALAAQGYNRIPVVLETLADLDTALSIYLKLAAKPGSYLFESVVGGERFGRFSFVGLPASERIAVKGREITITRDSQVVEKQTVDDPLAFIDRYLAQIKAAPLASHIRFSGGLVGYFSYDCVKYIEKRLDKPGKRDALGLPEIQLLRSEELAIVDNVSGKLYLVVYADPSTPHSLAAAQERLAVLRAKLRDRLDLPRYPGKPQPPGGWSNMSESEFFRAVDRCKQYIVDGDIMQVQVSQRITIPFDAPPINLYRALRSINPSPYMYFVDLGDAQIVGASPEIMVRREANKVVVRPIAGTRKRGATPERDREMEQELISDPKERAEHVMLIDLGRNDIGRIAKTGSVKVTETMMVERYSHVMHMVSNVEGEVDATLTPMELFRATFPAGTVTGTPKVRAMEIIEEMEPSKRGVYAGAVGYLGYNGNTDLAIAIRTGVITNGHLHVQAAAGIVADSKPELEWLETNNKAKALLTAAQVALSGIDAKLA